MRLFRKDWQTPELEPTCEEQAAEIFVRRLCEEWNEQDQRQFERRLEREPAFADAYGRVEKSWGSLDTHAEAPEVVTYRADAISTMRRANARRWLRTSYQWKTAASVAGLTLALAVGWLFSPYGYRPGEHRTGIGERHIIELDDQSRIALDAATRLRVRYSDDARTVRLLEGQAQFSVAKDSGRPFKVIAGDRTIVALGTVFTVEYVDRRIHVAMLEGKVAVLHQSLPRLAVSSSDSPPAEIPQPHGPGATAETNEDISPATTEKASSEEIYLTAGEALRVAHDGQVVFTPKADLEAATAWREGKVIFRTEPLGEAIHRMNRYSRLQLTVDDAALAAKRISGVFEAGDTRGFIDALQRYLPVTASYSDADTVRLSAK